jgi:hypothetical protein
MHVASLSLSLSLSLHASSWKSFLFGYDDHATVDKRSGDLICVCLGLSFSRLSFKGDSRQKSSAMKCQFQTINYCLKDMGRLQELASVKNCSTQKWKEEAGVCPERVPKNFSSFHLLCIYNDH